MDLSSVTFSFVSLLFIIVCTLPCVQCDVPTMSPGLSQSSTLSYQDTESLCSSPQYFELGMRAVLNCSFPQIFFGIFWYNAHELLKPKPLPLIYLKPSEKGGNGYKSNEYDINEKGCLIINNVTLQHDQNFSAVVLESSTDEYSPHNVHVIVTVKPYQTYPHIEGCHKDERVCFRNKAQPFELTCTVVDARPNVQLEWFTKTFVDYHLLTSEKNVTSQNFLFTTRAKVSNIVTGSKTIMVYVCRSVSMPSLLKNNESMIVTKGVLEGLKNVLPETKYVQYYKSYFLTCTDEDVMYIVWQKQHPNGSFENIMDILFTSNASFFKSYSTDVELEHRDMVFSKAIDSDEGLYICIFGDGISEDVRTFNVKVYELSDPAAYPFVEGCNHPRSCDLYIDRKSTLTCVIKGVRPNVTLEWGAVTASHTPLIAFFNNTRRIKRTGFKFEVSLTSDIRIQNGLTSHIPIKCTASNYEDDLVVSTYIFLIPVGDQSVEEQTSNEGLDKDNQYQYVPRNGIWALFGLMFPAVAIIIFGVCQVKNRRNTQTNSSPEEEPLVYPGKPDPEKVSTFKTYLKTKYKGKCEALRPLPYERTSKYTIDEIFVECPIEQFEKNIEERGEDGSLRKIEVWKKLKSHNDFLDGTSLQNTRIILEGDPGYGKSTLGFRLAYDWYTAAEESPLKDVDIFIFLRLRHLKNLSSIPTAIKQFLLPADSVLTVKDVGEILYYCKTLVIFLDGFNRFPNQMDYEKTVVKDILEKDVFSASQVIITTRPSCFPEKYSDGTKRFRLVGFREETWEEYMDKIITDMIVKDKIRNLLDENPLLGDLCQVPLFFVLITHIANTGTEIKKSRLRTVTEFFSILMECFHAKMKTDTCKDCKHTSLSKICFNALIQNKEGLLWTKDEICNQLCEALYKEYRDTGILIEEEFRCNILVGKQHGNNNVRYYTKVRFFHNIFCEWYAARELSTVLAKSTKTGSKECLRKINPFDHQYVFRFACGMNTAASGKIVKYMQTFTDYEKFAILCYVEQSFSKTSIDDSLKKIFSSPVNITEHDTSFLQSWTLGLLEIAATDKVNIECVWLGDMNISVDIPNKCIKLNSGVVFPTLATLNQLSIREPGRTFTETDIEGLIAYADLCFSLKSLRFRACLMPFCLTQSSKYVKGEKRLHVEWKYSNGGDWYRFNFQSGQWECDNQVLTKAEYEKIKKSVFAEHNISKDDDPGPSAS